MDFCALNLDLSWCGLDAGSAAFLNDPCVESSAGWMEGWLCYRTSFLDILGPVFASLWFELLITYLGIYLMHITWAYIKCIFVLHIFSVLCDVTDYFRILIISNLRVDYIGPYGSHMIWSKKVLLVNNDTIFFTDFYLCVALDTGSTWVYWYHLILLYPIMPVVCIWKQRVQSPSPCRPLK